MAILKRNRKELPEEKILDVDATMQGTMTFKDPVNLHINGQFEGKLDTKGSLTIGQKAVVAADITGEDITIAGTVTGNILATSKLSIIAPARIEGDVKTPILSVSEGAVLNGRCQMSSVSDSTSTSGKGKVMAADEVARYLEVESSMVEEWAVDKQIPAIKQGGSWKFYKEDVDNWVAREKVSR
ncbi:MAG: polymer-forming cytoskeletal protein [Candidatus Omnitrophica bacterium]|nr:polymer-forming cytoskeletal protein [Candidatus Omnitrophota bacterium]